MKITDYELQDVSVVSDPMLLTLIKVDSSLKDDTDYEMINVINFIEGKANMIIEVEKQDNTFLMILENHETEFKFKDANNKLVHSTPKDGAVESITKFIKELK